MTNLPPLITRIEPVGIVMQPIEIPLELLERQHAPHE